MKWFYVAKIVALNSLPLGCVFFTRKDFKT